ncbi:MAG: site-specific integrase [Peptococcaceae bacterium]|nr:site-specific integrase [Peptococcaceae bacterium]
MAQVRRRGKNKYTISIYLGRDEYGKRRYHYETFHGTLTQAKLRAAELEVKLKHHTGPKQAAMSLGKYLEMWLQKIKGTVTERTWETYEWHVRRLIPVVGHLQLYNLTALSLQDALQSLQGLSPRTMRGIYGTLKTALRQAVVWGILGTDITAGLRTPRMPRKQRHVLTSNELAQLLDAAKGYKHYLVIRLLALTGMRLGEVLGLKWGDIDFDKHTITVCRSVDTRRRRLKPEGDETKTISSARTFTLDAETLVLLRQKKQEEKVTPLNKDDTLIFGFGDKPMGEDAIRKTLARALKKAGLPKMRIHDLRHTSGSILLDQGVPLPVVSAWLGHSSTATTAAVYAHAVRNNNNVLNLSGADKKADKTQRSQN